jgi:acyl dehydratase
MRYFEDFVVGSERRFGRYEVTAAEIKEFAAKYDPQPFHLDEAAGAASAMGTFCASGWHTAGMAMRMMVDEGAKHDARGMGSPGVDSLRWLRPVLPGDILSVQQTVLDAKASASKSDRGVVQSRCDVYNQRGDVVMTFTASAFYAKR